MLEVFLNSALDTINKGLELSQTLAKKGLKFLLSNENVGLNFYLLQVLLLMKKSSIFEEGVGKWHPILTFSPSGGKIVLTLLEKVIVF